MKINSVAKDKGIPKDLLFDRKITDVDFMDNLTVIYLDNGYDLYFHNDTGEVELVYVDVD